jgi:DNA-binding transcriptional ArsR family regulator
MTPYIDVVRFFSNLTQFDKIRTAVHHKGMNTVSPTPPELPPPLPEPAREELKLETVLAALADPLRLQIIQKLLLESEDYDHPCGWFGFDRPKSSLTHHFKALREAGLIRQRQYGLERRSRVRDEDLEQRFPGLLALVKNWRPPGA